jgi:transposase
LAVAALLRLKIKRRLNKRLKLRLRFKKKCKSALNKKLKMLSKQLVREQRVLRVAVAVPVVVACSVLEWVALAS